MPEHNRQLNVHIVGNLSEGELEAIVSRLDCNTHQSGDSRSRLTWLIWNANLVILLPDWKDSDRWLTELSVAVLLGIELKFLHEVLDV